MEATAIVLGASAVVLIFAPETVLASLAIESSPTAVPLAQLYGAALFAFPQTFWTARGMLLGGIYGRAVVVGGFTNSRARRGCTVLPLPVMFGTAPASPRRPAVIAFTERIVWCGDSPSRSVSRLRARCLRAQSWAPRRLARLRIRD